MNSLGQIFVSKKHGGDGPIPVNEELIKLGSQGDPGKNTSTLTVMKLTLSTGLMLVGLSSWKGIIWLRDLSFSRFEPAPMFAQQ